MAASRSSASPRVRTRWPRAAAASASRRVEIEVGARQKAVDIGDVVLERGAQIRGRVRDKTGARRSPTRRCAGTRTVRECRRTVPLEGRTEADGTFVLGGASATSYRISVQAAGFAPLNQPVDAPSDGVELVLEAAGAIKGLVVDDAGRPVESFDVTAQPAGGRELMTRQAPSTRRVAGEGGSFTLEDVGAGTYAVQVAGRDLGRQVVSDVKVAAGAVTDIGRIRLAAGAAVRGTVIDASGAPIAAATVEARGSDRSTMVPSDFQSTSTDGAGSFHLRGLPTGTMIVIARHPDFAEGRSAPVEIEPARTADTSVVLHRGGRIEGVVRRRGGGAPPDAAIMVSSMASPGSFSMPPTVVPRADGSFAIDHVTPGRVAVSLTARGTPGGMAGGVFKEVGGPRRRDRARSSSSGARSCSPARSRAAARRCPTSGLPREARWAVDPSWVRAAASPRHRPGPQRMTAVTREDGSYEMIVGEPGRIMVRAEATAGGTRFPMRMIDRRRRRHADDGPGLPRRGHLRDRRRRGDRGPDRPRLGRRGAREAGPLGGGNAMTAADGRFTIDLDPGAFRLRVAAEGYAVRVPSKSRSETRPAPTSGSHFPAAASSGGRSSTAAAGRLPECGWARGSRRMKP